MPKDAISQVPVDAQDRWLLWPIVATTVTFFLFVLLIDLPGALGFFLVFFAWIPIGFVVLGLVAAAVMLGFKKYFRMAASAAAALVVPILLRLPIAWLSSYIHLALTVWFGIGVLGPVQNSDVHGFSIYDWSVGLVSNGNTFLIRDPTDKIGSPINPRTNTADSRSGFTGECAGRTRHLLGHYYICEF
jgi:hypothetical protein